MAPTYGWALLDNLQLSAKFNWSSSVKLWLTASDTVRDLGVTLDAQLTMKNHVDGVARSCFYQLRQLRSIRRSVPSDALHTLVHAFTSTLIDYCNAVLNGVFDAVIRQLQAVLHAAARLITGVRRNDHITPTLRDILHWLNVSQRIAIKIPLMTYNCIHGQWRRQHWKFTRSWKGPENICQVLKDSKVKFEN